MNSYEIPENLIEEINALEHKIEAASGGNLSQTELKAHRVPFGVYEQREEGSYMLRVRCNAGVISPEQLRAVAETAEKFGSPILHVTTRQELQVHDLQLEDVIPCMKKLLPHGLSSRGGGGNTLRNIMASWDSGVSPLEVFDVTPHAIAVANHLLRLPESYNLPRKLKISFCNGGSDNAGYRVNDLGFLADYKEGNRGFRVFVAGGLGRNPQQGHELHKFISEEKCVPVARAILSLFSKYGERKNRNAARLRFLWNKLGKDEFLKKYFAEYSDCLNQSYDPLPEPVLIRESKPVNKNKLPAEVLSFTGRFVVPQKQLGLNSLTLPLSTGHIEASKAIRLADFASTIGEDSIRFTRTQNIVLRHVPDERLEECCNLFSDLSPLTKLPSLVGDMVTCTGAETCKLGICRPRPLYRAILKKIRSESNMLNALKGFQIRFSGCPNSCGAHMTADIGFAGRATRKDSHLYPSYHVYVGAGLSADSYDLAVPTGTVSARRLPDFLSELLTTLDREDVHPENFKAWLADGGLTKVKILVDAYSRVPHFSEDKNDYFDWEAEEIFSLKGAGKGECSAGLYDLIDVDRNYLSNAVDLLKRCSTAEQDEVLRQIALTSARMLLVTRGSLPTLPHEVVREFEKHFVDTGLVAPRLGKIPSTILSGTLPEKSMVIQLYERMEELYESMDGSFHFKDENKSGEEIKKVVNRTELELRDYRGVGCPMNFVKVKMDLAKLNSGDQMEVLLDNGAPIENVPRSVSAEGHHVGGVEKQADGSWKVTIKKA